MNHSDAERAELIRAQNCLLTPLSSAHKNDVFKLYCDKNVQRYLGDVMDDKTAFQKRFSEILQDDQAMNRTVFLQESEAFMGITCIDLHHDKQDYEVGFKFLPEFWGLGLTAEAVNKSIGHAVVKLKLKTIVAETQEANLRARKFLEKLSFEQEKSLIRHNEQQVLYRKIF